MFYVSVVLASWPSRPMLLRLLPPCLESFMERENKFNVFNKSHKFTTFLDELEYLSQV
jgi:hypothetical protein